MNNIIFRFYNRNRKKIIIFIVAIVFIILLIQSLNKITQISNKKDSEKYYAIVGNEEIRNNSYDNANTYKENDIINNSENYINSNEQVINLFIEKCNNGKTNEAYDMLTDDCKKTLFPTVNLFNENYIKKIFLTQMSADITESLYGTDIYRISYYKRITLANVNENQKILEDYIRVEKNNNIKKISLNGFLYTQDIGTSSNMKNIFIEIENKEIYIDYEIYTIKVTNNTENTVMIGQKDNVNSVALIDKNNVQYSSFIDEMPIETLIVNAHVNKEIKIKFNKLYDARRVIEYMELSIVMNYDENLTNSQYQILNNRISV